MEHLVIHVRSLLWARRVQVPGVALRPVVGSAGTIPIALSRREIKNLPQAGSLGKHATSEPDETEVMSSPPRGCSALDLCTYVIITKDGVRGRVDDLLFEDETWRLRYLVCGWLTIAPSRRIWVDVSCVREVNHTVNAVILNMHSKSLLCTDENIDQLSSGSSRHGQSFTCQDGLYPGKETIRQWNTCLVRKESSYVNSYWRTRL